MYYVYIHRFYNGTFYIGKGTKNRWVDTKRNTYWCRLCSKYGEPIKGIYREGLSEKEAFELERTLILLFKEVNLPLCNLTDGGEGVSGYRHTTKAKQQIAEKQKGNKYSDPEILRNWNKNKTCLEEYEFTHPVHGIIKTYPANLAHMFNLQVSHVHSLVKGNYASTGGWCIKGNIKITRGRIFLFTNNKTTQQFTGTLVEFDKVSGLSKGSARKLVAGIKKQTRDGWEFIKEIKHD